MGLDGPIEVPAGVTAKISHSGSAYGPITGAGNVKVNDNRILKLYGTNTITGTFTFGNAYSKLYAYDAQAIPDVTKVTDGYLYWMCRAEDETVGITADGLRDTIFPLYATAARKIAFGVTEGKTFTYPHALPTDTAITAYGAVGGTFACTMPQQTGKALAFSGGDFAVAGTPNVQNDLGNLSVSGSGRVMITNLVTKSAASAKIDVTSASQVSEPAELVLKDVKLDVANSANAFLLGSSDRSYGKSILEIGAGCAITNDFVLGDQSGASSASAVYVRPGAYLRVARITGVLDTTFGEYAQGFLE